LGCKRLLQYCRDYYNIVEWIYVSDATWLARTYTLYYVETKLIIEEDTVFNDFYPWTTTGQTDRYDVQNAATHEAGHFLLLYDLTESGDEDQTMWYSIALEETKKRTLEWGDRAGVRYIYPNRYQVGGGTLGSESQDGDVAIGYINSGSVLDMVVAWADNPSGDNYVKYRFGWDISSSTGAPTSWSSTNTMPGGIGYETQGVGAALVNLDATANLDMVILWVDNPSGNNAIYYKIGWNLNTAGTPASWSDRKSVTATVGQETQGAGVSFVNLDGNSRPEMVVAWVDNPSGDNTIYYVIGWNVTTSGNPASWSSRFSKTGGIGSETAGLGITFANVDDDSIPDMVLFWIDNPSGANHGYYQVGYDVSNTGSVGSWSQKKTMPGDWQWVGSETQGAGIAAADLNSNGRTEFMFVWIDNPSGDNYAYHRTEWEGRVNSHN